MAIQADVDCADKKRRKGHKNVSDCSEQQSHGDNSFTSERDRNHYNKHFENAAETHTSQMVTTMTRTATATSSKRQMIATSIKTKMALTTRTSEIIIYAADSAIPHKISDVAGHCTNVATRTFNQESIIII